MALSERLNPSGECNTESNFAMDCSLLSTKTVDMFRCVPDRIGIWKCWLWRRDGNQRTLRKTSRSKRENHQSGFWTRALQSQIPNPIRPKFTLSIKDSTETNRPLPNSKSPHFQNEARCTTFLVKMSFIFMRKKNDFHIKGWASTFVLKQGPGGTRKWPISGH